MQNHNLLFSFFKNPRQQNGVLQTIHGLPSLEEELVVPAGSPEPHSPRPSDLSSNASIQNKMATPHLQTKGGGQSSKKGPRSETQRVAAK